MFLFKRVVSSLILPPFGLFFLSAFFALFAMGPARRRGALLLSVLCVLLGLFVSTSWVSRHLIAVVENLAGPTLTAQSARAILAAPNPPGAVVVLGGGIVHDDREPDGPLSLHWYSLQRTLYGARLAKQTGLKVLVSGGATPPNKVPEAQIMAQVMNRDLGQKAEWVEGISLDTRGNAIQSAKMLASTGVKHVFLVTHAAHMFRSRIEFERVGLKVTAAPMGFQAGEGAPRSMSWLPGPSGAVKTWYAVHELVGLLWYRIYSPSK
jgi:uncharacterized SAM-binding protein YcdF (DUF218 family)